MSASEDLDRAPEHNPDTAGLARFGAGDLALDHLLAQMSGSLQFLLDITPVNSDEIKSEFVAGRVREPAFDYRPLDSDPEVLAAALDVIDVSRVEDPTLGHLLRAKHRELRLQIQMLAARDTADFAPLGIELYGATSPELRAQAENVLSQVAVPEAKGTALSAAEFLDLAQEEIVHYRELDPDIAMHAEIRDEVNGIMVSGDTLLIDPDSTVQAQRARALLQHEVGTHLVTQVNGAAQPIRVLGAGLAGYDETQEGLAVLAEIATGQLTAFRLRQLAARVLTVHRMQSGADFVEAWRALLDEGIPGASAFTTTMRAYRSGGLSKDAVYLRGLVDLLVHLRDGGDLDLLWLGKFSLRDLPLIAELATRGLLNPARITPRFLSDPSTSQRMSQAARAADDVTQLIKGAA